jgi:hypothetical protein
MAKNYYQQLYPVGDILKKKKVLGLKRRNGQHRESRKFLRIKKSFPDRTHPPSNFYTNTEGVRKGRKE